MNLLDLPPDMRAKRLARMGMIEAQYKDLLIQRKQEREFDATRRVDGSLISDKFKQPLVGIVNDNASE